MSSGVTVTSHTSSQGGGDSHYHLDRLQQLSSMVRDKTGDGKEKLYLNQSTTRITRAPPPGQLTPIFSTPRSNSRGGASGHPDNSSSNNHHSSTTPAGSGTIEDSMRNMSLQQQQHPRSSGDSTHSNNSRYDPVTGARRSPLTTPAPADEVQQRERDEDDDLRSTLSHRSNLSNFSARSNRSGRSNRSPRVAAGMEGAPRPAAPTSESLSMAERDFLAKYGHLPSGNGVPPSDRGRMMSASVPGATAVRSNHTSAGPPQPARRELYPYANRDHPQQQSYQPQGGRPSAGGRPVDGRYEDRSSMMYADRSPSHRNSYGQQQQQAGSREAGNYRYDDGPYGNDRAPVPRGGHRGSLAREMSHSTLSTSGFNSFYSGSGPGSRGDYHHNHNHHHHHQQQQQYHPADYNNGRSRGDHYGDNRSAYGNRGSGSSVYSQQQHGSRYDDEQSYGGGSRYGDREHSYGRYNEDHHSRYGGDRDYYNGSRERDSGYGGRPSDASYGGGSVRSSYSSGRRGYSSSSAPAEPERPLIEVAPGLFMHLMGTQDTMKAIQRGTITVTNCVCCSTDIHCTDEAEFILCPDCRVVSPVNQLENMDMVPTNGGLVGLGIKTDMLVTMMNGQG